MRKGFSVENDSKLGYIKPFYGFVKYYKFKGILSIKSTVSSIFYDFGSSGVENGLEVIDFQFKFAEVLRLNVISPGLKEKFMYIFYLRYATEK